MRSHMETSPGEASFSSTNSSSPTQSYTGHEELDGPSDKLVREIEKGKTFLEGEENGSFIEQAACVEEEIQELCSLGMLPLEQRVKRKRLNGKQPVNGAGNPAEASPGGDCIATKDDQVMPRWKVNKKARVLYAAREAKVRPNGESYDSRYQEAHLDWRNLDPIEQRT